MKKMAFCLVIVGLVLAFVVPVQATSVASGGTHIVQPGQTLFSVARWYGVDVWALARANNIVNPNYIYVGQRLHIPSSASAPAASGVYVVKPGDNLYSIAHYYGLTAWAIAQANGIYNINHIYVGQRLVIPGLAPKPAPKRAPTSSSVWRGEYYAGTDLAGGPVFVRDDRAVNFHWGLTSPDTRLNTDKFSVHWTRSINFRGGVYRFMITVDDGARLWVDGTLALDVWHVQPETSYDVEMILTPGKHTIAIDYFDEAGVATIQFAFKRIGDEPVDDVPTPTPGGAPTGPVGGWSAQYFGNMDLYGDAVVTRTDAYIDFDWGLEAPLSDISEDFFSVRWTQQAEFYEDNYVFCARADDGVRLYLENVMVIDEWHGSNGYPNYCEEVNVTQGLHTVVVEYYEDGGDALIAVWWERR